MFIIRKAQEEGFEPPFPISDREQRYWCLPGLLYCFIDLGCIVPAITDVPPTNVVPTGFVVTVPAPVQEDPRPPPL